MTVGTFIQKLVPFSFYVGTTTSIVAVLMCELETVLVLLSVDL
jgi:hypothetical protein